MKKAILIIVVVAAVAALGWWLFMRDDTNRQQSSTSTERNESAFSDKAIITYTDTGFSPSTLTVPAGTTVTITNESSEELEFSSDNHPVHTDNPELNQEALSPGDSTTVTLNKTGTWGYHNHFNPDKTGTIVVE